MPAKRPCCALDVERLRTGVVGHSDYRDVGCIDQALILAGLGDDERGGIVGHRFMLTVDVPGGRPLVVTHVDRDGRPGIRSLEGLGSLDSLHPPVGGAAAELGLVDDGVRGSLGVNMRSGGQGSDESGGEDQSSRRGHAGRSANGV